MCELLDRGLARKLVDTQDFDLDAVNNVRTNPNHFPISAGEYASPMNKGAFVNKLDYVILASLEVDTHFNCNVVVGSDGIITGAQGGHPDTAQGAKCTIVIAPLLQGRIPAICTDVTTVTTPGESVDIVVTDYGVAVNPRRPDLLEALKAADCVCLVVLMMPCAKLPGSDTTHCADALPMKQRHTAIRRIVLFIIFCFQGL